MDILPLTDQLKKALLSTFGLLSPTDLTEWKKSFHSVSVSLSLSSLSPLSPSLYTCLPLLPSPRPPYSLSTSLCGSLFPTISISLPLSLLPSLPLSLSFSLSHPSATTTPPPFFVRPSNLNVKTNQTHCRSLS